MTPSSERSTSAGDDTRDPCVLIVGSGFGGYFAARRLSRLLRRTGTLVVLLSDSDGMLYAPLLPDVAVGAVDPRAVTVPTATGSLASRCFAVAPRMSTTTPVASATPTRTAPPMTSPTTCCCWRWAA